MLGLDRFAGARPGGVEKQHADVRARVETCEGFGRARVRIPPDGPDDRPSGGGGGDRAVGLGLVSVQLSEHPAGQYAEDLRLIAHHQHRVDRLGHRPHQRAGRVQREASRPAGGDDESDHVRARRRRGRDTGGVAEPAELDPRAGRRAHAPAAPAAPAAAPPPPASRTAPGARGRADPAAGVPAASGPRPACRGSGASAPPAAGGSPPPGDGRGNARADAGRPRPLQRPDLRRATGWPHRSGRRT